MVVSVNLVDHSSYWTNLNFYNMVSPNLSQFNSRKNIEKIHNSGSEIIATTFSIFYEISGNIQAEFRRWQAGGGGISTV